ncbi:guanylate kinase [Faecalicatena contorta]|uniref:guanylate kinase n=1 Tax=Faecalicatena contorta TaxID=39482 RepID=UPI00129D391F|nr:guanylate kinase [Faecalicatena contorta]MRM89680.1 guanylate kinase [Faecalicatena contorta]
MGKICYIMGKSSSGKDTIFKKLKEILPQFRTIILYTTRPIRAGETDGVEYYFTDEAKLESLEKQGAVIEMRAYHTKCGVWKYFTADDGQIDLEKYHYIVIGTLQSYEEMRRYFGEDRLVPVYIEVEDGERLSRALMRERQQSEPKYSEMCRRFLADQEDFSEENLENAGIMKRFQNNNMEECIQEIQMYLEREMEEG